MRNRIDYKGLEKHFNGSRTYTGEELFDFFRKKEPNLNESTFRWRVHNLKKMHIIRQVASSRYVFSHKAIFFPDLDKSAQDIAELIEVEFVGLGYCVWSTGIINEFMLHIPDKSLIILQVERNAIEPVFKFLKTQGYGNLFIEPNNKEIEHYVFDSSNSIVILPLVSKSPIQTRNGVKTTTIEKLIVDLFCDKNLFAFAQGSEFTQIVNTAFKRYAFDFTKLLNYAKRRGRESLIKDFVSNTFETNILF